MIEPEICGSVDGAACAGAGSGACWAWVDVTVQKNEARQNRIEAAEHRETLRPDSPLLEFCCAKSITLTLCRVLFCSKVRQRGVA